VDWPDHSIVTIMAVRAVMVITFRNCNCNRKMADHAMTNVHHHPFTITKDMVAQPALTAMIVTVENVLASPLISEPT